MRQWIRRLTIFIIALVLLSALVIQVILWTDLPRQWVLDYLSAYSGVEISVGSFSTAWRGQTTLKNVALRLPSEQDAFLIISQINLSHTSLPLILATRLVKVDSMRIDEILLRIRQGETRRWNIEDIFPLINELNSNNQSQQKRLPRLDIAKATVIVLDRTGQTKKCGPFNFRGEYKSSMVWNFKVSAPEDFDLRGKLTTGKIMFQDIDFTLKENGDLFEILFLHGRRKVHANGNWHGRLRQGKLTGQLHLQSLQIGSADVRGSIDIDMEPNGVLISPKNLFFSDSTLLFQKIKVIHGVVRLQQNKCKIDKLAVETGSLAAFLNGSWNWQLGNGHFTGSWVGTVAKKGLQHAGTWDCSLAWPRTGPGSIRVKATTEGQSQLGHWKARAEVVGSGVRWQDSQWQTSISHLSWQHRNTDINLKDVMARFLVEGTQIRLTELNLPNASLTIARGNFSTKDQSWSIALEADKLEIEEPNGQPFNIRLLATGNKHGITLKDFWLDRDDITVATAGRIILPSTELKDVRASLKWLPKASGTVPVEPTVRMNQWQVDANVTGTVRPFNLSLHSYVAGENVTLGKRTIPSLSIPLQAKLTPNRIEFNSSKTFDLFGGACWLSGYYEFSSRATHLDLRVGEISLTSIGKVVGSPLLLQGQFTGDLGFETTGFERDQFVASGSWKAKDIKIPPFGVEHGEGKLYLRDGIVRLEPIHLRHNQGTAIGKMHFSLAQPHLLYIELTADKWPISVSKYHVQGRAEGNTKIALDVLKRSAQGVGNLSAELLLRDKSLGHITFSTDVKGRNIDLQKIKIKALGGVGQGIARIPLDSLFTSDIELKWDDLELAQVANWWPRLNGLAGKFSGSLTAKKADVPRPFEPLVLQLEGRTIEGGFRNIKLNNCDATAYLGEKRLLIDRSIFDFSIGTAQLRGSLSRHADDLFTRVQVNLTNLDLDEVVRSFHPEVNRVIGLLSGKGTIMMFSDLRLSTGEADLELAESDLVDNKVIRTLYDALGLKLGEHKLTGQGRIKIQAEGSRLQIPSFFYYNRGVEVRGAGTIKDLGLGLESPIGGYAVSSTRPLKGMTLPGTKELDKLMHALQGDVACVNIEGTLGKPIVKTVPFPKISGEFRRLLWSQLRKKTKVE